jgi:FAD-dependent urate hydroxylase
MNKNQNTKEITIIIGAGIGGLTAALTMAMRKDNNFNKNSFEIYERRKDICKIGGNITLFPNAVRILKELGCIEELYRYGWIVEKATFVDSNLKLIAIREIGNREIYGEHTIAIQRADLIRIMHRRLGDLNKKVNFNTELKIDFDKTNNKYLIADGSSSVNRAILEPDFKRIFQNIIYYGGYINCDEEYLIKVSKFLNLNNFNQTIIINNSSFMGLSVIKNDDNKLGLHWYTYLKSENPLNQIEIDLKKKSLNISEVLEVHNNLHKIVIELINNTNKLIIANIYETMPTSNCIDDCYILFGDSAHNINPLSGQGAGMAIEDGFIYGLIMSRYNRENINPDIKKIFEKRKKRILKIQSKSRRSSKISKFILPESLIYLRNLFLKISILMLPNKLKNSTFFYNSYDELRKLNINYE